MRTITTRGMLLLALSFPFGSTALAEQPVFPAKVSQNGRYIVDQKDDPVFWLGTTQWQVSVHFTREHGRIANGLAKGWRQIGLESPQPHGGGLGGAAVAA